MSVNLGGVHPLLIAAVTKVLNAMQELGHPMMVTDALRSMERQQELYAKGRTAPGAIVTNADGITHRSNHQAHDDGFGYAVDCCFVVEGQPSWLDSHPWRLYGEAAKAIGCRWGGEFKTIIDRPHIEWPHP